MRRLAAIVLMALAAFTAARGSDPTAAELDAIRDQLVALDVEKALAAVAGILDRPDLSEAARVDALDLRAQAHAVSDDLDAAEEDYRAILTLRAEYAPNAAVTSKKAMDRFAKTRAKTVGTVQLDLDPKDAVLTVDDRSMPLTPERSFPALAGERRLKFSRRGFDSLDATVHAVAGEDTLLKIRLVPNARTLVARSDVEGVEVSVDGVASGATSRSTEQGGDATPSVTLEYVAIGEHELRFTKSCFATESREEVVSVDLADRSPKILPTVAMRPARTRVSASGASYEGELRVDGERVATLPLTSFTMCPGARSVEVSASGRVVWSGSLNAEESDVTLDLAPRPNAILVGASWPGSWAAAASRWSLRERIDVPADVELTSQNGWAHVPLPPGTDLAVAVIPGAGVAGDERTVLYSPLLKDVEDRSSPPPNSPPSWTMATLGAVFVDGEAGAVLAASIAPEGPAAKAGLLPGDRVVAIAGHPAGNAAAVREAVAKLPIHATVVLDVAPPTGEPRKIECATAAAPRIAAPRGEGSSRVVRAAWASVGAAAGGPEAAGALANLAVLLEGAGADAAALDAWRRVRAAGGGALAARADYAVGAGLEAKGRRAEAAEAFQRAESESSRDGDPALAAAARDRLADLGVATP
jgi:PDZ domain